MPSREYWDASEEERNNFFEKTWPGRKVYHYDYKMEKGAVVENVEVKYLPKNSQKLTSRCKKGEKPRVRPEIREALWIKPSRTALLKGITPFSVGHQPQKYSYMDGRWFGFLRSPLGAKYPYDPLYHDRVGVGGAWPTQKVDFQKMCDPKTYTATYEDYFKALEVRGDKLLLPVCSKPTVGDVFMAKTNPKSFSGVVCSRWFGRSHKIADGRMKPVAAELFSKVTKKLTADTSLWGIGGRSRRQKQWKDGPLRSRCLLMPEGVTKILGLSVVQRVYDALSQINFNNCISEIRIGGNDFHGSYFSFSDKWADGNDIIEADISCHDGNSSEESMVAAWGIVRGMFPEGRDMDSLFLYMMSGFVFKNVVVPGRFVYRCLSGIPTGSPFTSLIVSLVNWLNWSLLLAKENTPEAALGSDVAVFGDDTLVKPHPDCEVSMWDTKAWCDKFQNVIGHTLDPCRLVNSKSSDDESKPSFLKCVPINGLPCRLLKDTMLFCSQIRKSNRSDLRYANLIKTLQYSGPFHPQGSEFLMAFRRYLLIRHIEVQPYAARPPDIYKWATAQCNISQRASEKQYLFPYIYGWDVVKNVDLGNKPKRAYFSTLNEKNDRLVDYVVNTDYFKSFPPELVQETTAGNGINSWWTNTMIAGKQIYKNLQKIFGL
jgi:hypothetical protein